MRSETTSTLHLFLAGLMGAALSAAALLVLDASNPSPSPCSKQPQTNAGGRVVHHQWTWGPAAPPMDKMVRSRDHGGL